MTHHATRVGFTLVEVIISLGLTFMLMAALFQAMQTHERYTAVVGEKLAQSQTARNVLHQIAEELRRVQPPIGDPGDPIRARTLLDWGDNEPTDDESTPALTGEQSTPALTDGAAGELPEKEGAERFGLMGSPHRLLMLVHGAERGASPLERFEAEASTPSPMPVEGEDRRREPSRWGDVEQIYYLLRPLPEGLQRREAGGESASTLETEVDAETPEEERYEPYYGGLLRQVVHLPFSTPAHDDSFAQLRGELFLEEEGAGDGFVEDVPTEPSAAESVLDEKPMPPRTETRLISDRVQSILFRYHDGSQWLPTWRDPRRLPVAVEIQLSFDPRASDPLFVKKYFEDRRPLTEGEEGVAPGRTPNEEEEPPLYAYRLVVALPSAVRPAPMSAAEGEPLGEKPPRDDEQRSDAIGSERSREESR